MFCVARETRSVPLFAKTVLSRNERSTGRQAGRQADGRTGDGSETCEKVSFQ